MLEINVSEQIYVVDSIGDAMAIIKSAIEKVIADDNFIPVNILISKPRANSPPALGINVSDISKLEDKLV